MGGDKNKTIRNRRRSISRIFTTPLPELFKGKKTYDPTEEVPSLLEETLEDSAETPEIPRTTATNFQAAGACIKSEEIVSTDSEGKKDYSSFLYQIRKKRDRLIFLNSLESQNGFHRPTNSEIYAFQQVLTTQDTFQYINCDRLSRAHNLAQKPDALALFVELWWGENIKPFPVIQQILETHKDKKEPPFLVYFHSLQIQNLMECEKAIENLAQHYSGSVQLGHSTELYPVCTDPKKMKQKDPESLVGKLLQEKTPKLWRVQYDF